LAFGILSLLAAQIASGFFLRPILEREGRRIFRVPVHIDRAGANIFGGSFWMKGIRIKNVEGFGEGDLMHARTLAVNLNLTSLLTHEFSVGQILLKDPFFWVEMNQQGSMNVTEFLSRAIYRFQKFAMKKQKLLQSITSYELEKFAIRRGTINLIDRRKEGRVWTLESVSFSLARVLFPPDAQEALPIAIYLNATARGAREGQILVLGRLNPFAAKKSFDITLSAKDIALNEHPYLVSDVPLQLIDGNLQLKVKALCHENQADLYFQVRLSGLKLGEKELLGQKGSSLLFGLPAETVVDFFNDLQPVSEPFSFEFRLAGDLDDPKFNLTREIKDKIREKISDRVLEKMAAAVEETRRIAEGATASP
jgi:hypothetical protein